MRKAGQMGGGLAIDLLADAEFLFDHGRYVSREISSYWRRLISTNRISIRFSTGSSEASHKTSSVCSYSLESNARDFRVKKGNMFLAAAGPGLVGVTLPTDEEFTIVDADNDRPFFCPVKTGKEEWNQPV
jgi:hypothetical protein